MIGTIFDIKEFSVFDGPGVRVSVFLKGCPLRCLWCHNPEGLSPAPELRKVEHLCTRCGACTRPCDHTECTGFDRCYHACPNGALTLCGQRWEHDELAKKLAKYETILALGGGVTITGGEPLLQAKFACALLDALPPTMHKALETSGCGSEEDFAALISRCDYVMMDIKLFDEEAHRQYTGVSNKQILRNYNILRRSGIEHVVRVPLIPGVTDTKENLAAIADFVGDARVELLPYNDMAGAKYKSVGREYTFVPPRGCDTSGAALFKNAVVR